MTTAAALHAALQTLTRLSRQAARLQGKAATHKDGPTRQQAQTDLRRVGLEMRAAEAAVATAIEAAQRDGWLP